MVEDKHIAVVNTGTAGTVLSKYGVTQRIPILCTLCSTSLPEIFSREVVGLITVPFLHL